MKLLTLITLVLITSCGVEPGTWGFQGKPFPPPNTVERVACVRQDWGTNTKWKYIVISYPNETADVYCSIDWLRDRKREGFPGDPDSGLRKCVLDQWEFTSNPEPAVRFLGPGQEHSPSGEVLPMSFEFLNCQTTTWENESWYAQEYYLEEGAL